MFLLLQFVRSFIIQVWRHSCFSLSRSSGKFKLFENGEKAAEKVSASIKESLEKISKKVRFKVYLYINISKLFSQACSLLVVTTEILATNLCQCMDL